MGIKQIDRNIFIGDIGAAKRVLQAGKSNAEGISHVLTLRDEPISNDLVLKSGLTYKFIMLADMEDEDVLSEPGARLFDALEFVIGAIDGGGAVLVHCQAGISRSGTVLLAYLMWRRELKLDDAITFVGMKNWFVSPNSGFLSQLRVYEAMLRDPQTQRKLKRRLITSKSATPPDVGLVTNETSADATAGTSQVQAQEAELEEEPPSYYRCAHCRGILFGNDHVQTHLRRQQLRGPTSVWCAHQYLLTEEAQEAIHWLNTATVGTHDGKLLCPGREGRCGTKLGQFDWSGRQCLAANCGAAVRPWFHINQKQVDKLPLRHPHEADALHKLNIQQ